MSVNGDTASISGIDSNDQQAAYIFTRHEDVPVLPAKRRRGGRSSINGLHHDAAEIRFESLMGGIEGPEFVDLRMKLYRESWGATEGRIQTILEAANEDTLSKVTDFVLNTTIPEGMGTLPTGFIATGPSIASQSLLFKQIAGRLKSQINGPVVTLRSGDATNLKAALKQIIRDTTHQGVDPVDDDYMLAGHDGPNLLNYDLELLHRYVVAHNSERVVVAFQDSEAFDPVLLADIIKLFDCWIDRLPFTLLFGIATSVELFHERLSRAASRCLYGTQFDVEQTSSILERVFQVIVGPYVPLRLGPNLLSSLMARQHDHVQSIQVFTNSLKYAYMFHFYTNPLSILTQPRKKTDETIQSLQPLHIQTVRELPSFRRLIEALIGDGDKDRSIHAQDMLQNNSILLKEMEIYSCMNSTKLLNLWRRMCVLTRSNKMTLSKIELYLQAFKGTLNGSDTVRGILDSIKHMAPGDLISLVDTITGVVKTGDSDYQLEGWLQDDQEFVSKLQDLRMKTLKLYDEAKKAGKPVRSSYAAHHKGVRTTVIAQKVQLSYEKSTLSKHDLEFTGVVDSLTVVLKEYLTFDQPQTWFLSEVWITDFVSPSKDVFTPRPRHVLENSLSNPSDKLPGCDPSVEILSSSTAPTAILYNMYLESGSIINIADLKTSFFSIMEGEDSDDLDEKTLLMLFYQALAELKLLGMIKQSRKKVDHLAKSAWRGL
ncbi:origin recognition complex subunit 3 N-terminus-domain-containing protein [Calycina marina]|uniref:Origin recognition complex subunit 3 N-terminus-domain-containing protein n=1 Tax=Calycina marina TaxID=1763456 RepID=A0A9P8CBQ7_9HELO|nr:origin recognition complex subunit 3 N-terminus-domain-containing protein [Calycina marina]